MKSVVTCAAATAAVVLLLSGCAKNPESIAPMSMPVNAYSGLTCDQLASEHRKTDATLTQLSSDQRQAVTGDAIGVFLIGVPVSSLTGADKEGLIAQKKGEIVAIQSAERNQKCGAG